MYTRLQAFKRSDEFCNYNQIYTDFELVSPDLHGGEPSQCIEDFVILVVPILLSHEEIKEADEKSYI